jgi:hypothetical protein
MIIKQTVIETIIKLKYKQENFSAITSKKVIDKFIESCTKLDTSIFEPYINEEDYFQDLDKYRFLAQLKRAFDNVQSAIVKTVELKMTTCLMCNSGCIVHAFYKYGEKRFAYMIETKGEVLQDIYICNMNK